MANYLINIKKIIQIQIYIFFFCIYYIKSIMQNIKIKKLPYLTINKNNSDLPLRKLSIPSNVYGSAFGLNYYYANLYLGNDMKKQTYILDTGSTITTAPCQPYCIKCGNHLNSYHNVEDNSKIISCSDEKCKLVKSFCGNGDKCSFKTSYTEGSSLEGIYINELIRFGEDYDIKNGANAPIGCTTSENHLFFTQIADGIMGLANNDNNFIYILKKVGAIDNNIFGLCLAQMGGYFSIGEINTTFHREDITYLKMDKNSFFYSVNMNNIFINNLKISNYDKNKYSLIIDSGTTISYFPKEIFNEMVDKTKAICNSYGIKNACGKYEYDKDFGPCFSFESLEKMEEAIYIYWPNITFLLEDYKYKWTPDEYFFNVTNKMKIIGCMGFNNGNGKRIIMGSTWMIGHEIIFDRTNKKIGVVEANCDKNNNKTMNFIGIEKGYKEDMYEANIPEKITLSDYIFNEKLLSFYIITSIILFLIIIYLVVVLIYFKRRKRNAWLWFIKKEENDEDNNLIPIRYDINDHSNKSEKNSTEFSTVFLSESNNNNIKELKNSKYSKINE